MQLAEEILSSNTWGSFVTPGKCGKIQVPKLMIGFADCKLSISRLAEATQRGAPLPLKMDGAEHHQ